ncbi:putative phosphoglycerate mutase [Burkholderiales bacterium]|nr:putative phosphoglycerate mutase [Burkholderiales bacterium]
MPSPAQVCLVRHGETDWNISGVLQGWIDVPLNATGRQQSRALGAAYAGVGFTAVWTSPLSRAAETAQIVAKVLGLAPPTCHEGLKERRFGAIQGVPKAELAELNPVLMQQLSRRNPAAAFAEGEAMDEFADRVLNALRDIGTRHAAERVLVVTHGWVMDVITREIQRLPRHAILNLKRKNGEGIWLESDGSGIRPGTAPRGA